MPSRAAAQRMRGFPQYRPYEPGIANGCSCITHEDSSMNAGNMRSAIIAGVIAFVAWVIADSLLDNRSLGSTIVGGIVLGIITFVITLAITLLISRTRQRTIDE